MKTAERNPLQDLEVAITGRLGSMKRTDAVRRLLEAGATYVAAPTRTTDLLVVGQGGPALDDEGRPTHALRAARTLARQGSALRVVTETEWLAQLGLAQRQEGLERLYTVEQLARILRVPRARLNAWVRQGLIEPVKVVHRLRFFDFSQVAAARVLSRLVRAGVGPARIKRGLASLSRWFGEPQRTLAQLDVLANTLVVHIDEGGIAESTGQLRLEFDESAPLAPPAVAVPRRPRADSFEQGVFFESQERLDEALSKYRDAVSVGDRRPEVRFNLGNVLYALGHHAEAAETFLEVIEGDPLFVEAWNNLGNSLQELDKGEDAVRAYRQALEIEPEYADAHYNLAEALTGLGEHGEARRHWWSYLRQDPSGPSADEVRARLARG